jgi:hypothetical protein
LDDFFIFYKEQNIPKLKRSMRFIQLIIDESERTGEARIHSLNKLTKNYRIDLTISRPDSDNFQLSFPENGTLLELRKSIANQKKYVWKQINIFKTL